MKLLEELAAPSRIRPKVGDLFSYKIKNHYRYLRIIDDEALLFRESPALVAYFYSATSEDMLAIPELLKTELIIPVQLMTANPLREGYFIRIGNSPVNPEDRWPRHCFKSTQVGVEFVDEFGKPCKRFEPFGYNQVWGAVRIDWEISLALGIGDQQYDWLPDLPRPLYRKSMDGKLPHRQVMLVIPNFSKSAAQAVHANAGPLKPGYEKTDYSTQASSLLWDYIHSKGKLSSIATLSQIGGLGFNTEGTPREDHFHTYFTVKKRQHEQLYAALAELMKRLGIHKYWIEDEELGDWLAGTYKDPNHQTQ